MKQITDIDMEQLANKMIYLENISDEFYMHLAFPHNTSGTESSSIIVKAPVLKILSTGTITINKLLTLKKSDFYNISLEEDSLIQGDPFQNIPQDRYVLLSYLKTANDSQIKSSIASSLDYRVNLFLKSLSDKPFSLHDSEYADVTISESAEFKKIDKEFYIWATPKEEGYEFLGYRPDLSNISVKIPSLYYLIKEQDQTYCRTNFFINIPIDICALDMTFH